jgi:hypothetical protein
MFDSKAAACSGELLFVFRGVCNPTDIQGPYNFLCLTPRLRLAQVNCFRGVCNPTDSQGPYK